jgi:putative membrane protein
VLASVTSTGIAAWRAHPEVWVLVLGALAVGFYATRVIQPAAVAAGHPRITGRHKAWFSAAVLGLWLTSDWPVHDVAESQLYAVHMGQHLLLAFVLPAMFLLATPRWLLQLVVPVGGRAWSVLRWFSRPVVAGIIFNVVGASLHYSWLVNVSLENAAVHFVLHLLVFTSGLLMWMPVCGPVDEWRLAPMPQIFYLFMMSVMPTVPGGWLVFAEGIVYHSYDTPERLWGISALADQQAAGAVMKLGGSALLWSTIIFIFFRWAADEERERLRQRRSRIEAAAARRVAAGADEGAPLTY